MPSPHPANILTSPSDGEQFAVGVGSTPTANIRHLSDVEVFDGEDFFTAVEHISPTQEIFLRCRTQVIRKQSEIVRCRTFLYIGKHSAVGVINADSGVFYPLRKFNILISRCLWHINQKNKNNSKYEIIFNYLL